MEDISGERCEIRYQEIQDEANEKLEDARKELADGEAEAESELSEAWDEIYDGDNEIYDAKLKLARAKRELEARGEKDPGWREGAGRRQKHRLQRMKQKLADGRAAATMMDGAQLNQGKKDTGKQSRKNSIPHIRRPPRSWMKCAGAAGSEKSRAGRRADAV